MLARNAAASPLLINVVRAVWYASKLVPPNSASISVAMPVSSPSRWKVAVSARPCSRIVAALAVSRSIRAASRSAIAVLRALSSVPRAVFQSRTALSYDSARMKRPVVDDGISPVTMNTDVP